MSTTRNSEYWKALEAKLRRQNTGLTWTESSFESASTAVLCRAVRRYSECRKINEATRYSPNNPTCTRCGLCPRMWWHRDVESGAEQIEETDCGAVADLAAAELDIRRKLYAVITQGKGSKTDMAVVSNYRRIDAMMKESRALMDAMRFQDSGK